MSKFNGFYKSDKKAIAFINQVKKLEMRLDVLREKQDNDPCITRLLVINDIESRLSLVK